MARVIAIPPLPEVEGVFGLLAFLADAEACEQRLQQLEGMRQEINTLVEVYGKASEISGLHAQAEQALRDAEYAKQKAVEDADKIREAGKGDVDRAIANARLAEDTAKAERDRTAAMQTELQARLTAVAQKESEVAARENTAKVAMTTAQGMVDEANAVKAEYEERRRNLLAAVQ